MAQAGNAQGLSGPVPHLMPHGMLTSAVLIPEGGNTPKATSPTDATDSAGEGPRAGSKRTAPEGGAGSDQEKARAQQLQEKNRRAQQRFRERQKARVSDLQQQVMDLTKMVHRLEEEKASLANHAAIMDKMIAMKDEHIQDISKRLKAVEAADDGAPAARDVLEVTDSEGRLLRIPRGEVCAQLSRVWRGFVNRLAESLVEKGTEDTEGLVASACHLYKQAGQFDPSAMRKWILGATEEPEDSQESPWKRFQRIVKSLSLTAQQRQEICELHRMHLHKLDELQHQAAGVPAWSAGGEPDGERPPDALPGLTGHDLARRFLHHEEVSSSLRAVTREENNTQVEFDSALFGSILSPVQMARVIVQSYPMVPDGMLIANWIAHESASSHGEPAVKAECAG